MEQSWQGAGLAGDVMPLPYVVDLGGGQPAAAELVGGKAASLARLSALHLPVPCAFAVTTAAFDQFCETNRLRKDSLEGPAAASALCSGTWPAALRDEVSRALEQLPGETIAVRSSATCEDGDRFSLAGQFRSHLSVPRSQAFEKIASCWASLFARPAQTYLQRILAGEARMGVILQAQISPTWSGVAFSLDPVTKSMDGITVEWTTGMGDKLVRGDIAPERLSIPRGAATLSTGLPEPLTRHLLTLRAAFVEIERAYRCPVDVEWCATQDELFILQARPITTARSEDHILWSSANICENFPAPLAPLAWSFLQRFYQEYIRSVLRLFGWSGKDFLSVAPLLDEMMGIHQGRIHYNLTSWYQVISYFPWSAQISSAFDGYLGQEVPFRPPPASRAPGLRRRAQSLLGRLRFLLQLGRLVLRTGSWLGQLDRRFSEARPAWHTALAATGDPRAADGVAEAMARLIASDWRGPCAADVEVMILSGVLGHLIERWCERNPDEVLPTLFQGVVVKSDEPSRVLWKLSHSLAAVGVERARLQTPDFASWYRGLDPEHRQAFDGFLDRYGARCYSDCNLLAPTFVEKPELAFDLVRRYAQLPDEFSPESRQAAVAERERLLDQLCRSLGPVRASLFRLVARLSLRAIQHREQGRLAQSLLFGEARSAFLRVGELLHRASLLRTPEEVFELTWEEVRALTRGGYAYPESLLQLVDERRRSRAAAEEEALPRLFLLPAGGERPRAHGRPSQPAHAGGNRCLHGLPVSRGKVRARARVLRDPTRDVLEPGEILVATSTDPGWTPLILLAGGLVLERGGLLSHGAIVAREFGIPSLVQVKDACSEITDGTTVSLDADVGTITLEQHDA